MNLPSLLAAVFLTIVAASYRMVPAMFDLPGLLNFAPLMAIAFCGGIYLPRLLAWIVPLISLFISDILLNLHYGVAPFSWSMLGAYCCYSIAILLGKNLHRNPRSLVVFGGLVVANSLLFYLVTNSLSWLGNQAYSQNIYGWIQALTVGQPGYIPTWTFFLHSLVSDLLYSFLFVGCMHSMQIKLILLPASDSQPAIR